MHSMGLLWQCQLLGSAASLLAPAGVQPPGPVRGPPHRVVLRHVGPVAGRAQRRHPGAPFCVCEHLSAISAAKTLCSWSGRHTPRPVVIGLTDQPCHAIQRHVMPAAACHQCTHRGHGRSTLPLVTWTGLGAAAAAVAGLVGAGAEPAGSRGLCCVRSAGGAGGAILEQPLLCTAGSWYC